MKLSTGKVAFPIEFDNGDKAVIYFNPNDRAIQERINNFELTIEKKMKEIDFEKYKSKFENENGFDVDINDPEKLLEMSSEDLKAARNRLEVINDISNEYNEIFKKELDVVFDSPISDKVFKYCQPTDIVVVVDENGNEKREMYIMHFIHWFMIEMKKYGAENKSAMDKHLEKYRK